MKKSPLLLSGLVAALALTLGAGAPTFLAAEYGSISGKVIGTDGKPAQNIVVRIVTGGREAGQLPNDPIGGRTQIGAGDVVEFGRGERTIASGKTDANGVFKIAKVATGTYKAVVSMARIKPASTAVTVEAGKEATVEFKLEAK